MNPVWRAKIKLERGIPQTHWNCRTCKGRGCERCEYTGLQYLESVQSLIADPLLDVFCADSHSTHSMGREDIDVRCLGEGRPTVIELKHPKKSTEILLAGADEIYPEVNITKKKHKLKSSDESLGDLF